MAPPIRARSRALTPKQQKIHQQVHPDAPTQAQISLLKTGAQAEQARAHESERQYQSSHRVKGPSRFWVPYKGNEQDRTKEYIILDSDISQCPSFYEHAILNNDSGRRDLFEMCLKEVGHCPLCEKFGDSYYVQMISVVELLSTPFTWRDGTECWHRKRLLTVKYQQQESFWNLCKDTYGGNMRGARVVATRDASQRSAAIGVPRPCIEEGQIVQYSEQELLDNFGHEALSNHEGQVIKEANSDIYPYKYGELFPTPNAEELRMRYGGTIPAGSVQETAQVWGNGGQDKVTARDIKSHMKQQNSQSDSNLDDDLDDSIPF